ncbi:uncharacterized protein [Apostichopus japonicus]
MKRTLPDICLQLTLEENSAICIQRYFRGYQGRKRYLQALILKFEEEERLRSKKTLQQLEEGELLLENHRLEVELEDNQCLRRNKEQRRLSQILTIQRAWKKYKRSTVGINSSSSNHGNQRKQLNSTTDASAEDVNGNNVQETRCTITIDTQNSRQPVKSSQTAQNTMSKRMNSKSPVYAVSDLGSDLEIDHCQLSADASPETPSRGRGKLNCNRLSLAEEFATMEEQILGEKALESEEDESDYYGGSSEVTTPEWDSDKIEHHERPEISLRRGKSPQMNSPDGGDGSMLIGGKRTTLEDSNKYGSDLNANLKSLQDGRNNISNSLQYYTTSDRENMTNPLDKRKVEEIKPEVRIGKVSCGGVESDTTNHSQLMNHSTSSSSNSAQSNFPKVEVSKVKDMCPTCDGVQGTNPTQSDGDVTMPVLDWESLERHLAKMEIEEKNKKQNIEEMPSQQSPRQVQKNSRIEILRKLAMGEEDIEGDIYGKGRDKLSSRLQSGMNLQICFVNDSVDGSDAEEDSGSNATPRVANRDSRFLFSRESSVGSPSSGTSPKTPSVTFEDLEDFESKQARLQAETRIALAQVKEVVKLQMELDRQQKKKSPTTELAGVSGLSDISEGLSNNHFDQKLLQRMSISKLQFIANELHSKIEKLNEELVQLLMTRDELQHGQDSQLVDIEDLTRWIRMSEFRQERGCIHPSQDQDFESNMHQNNNNTLLGHEPMTNNPRRKQAEQTLLKLLGRSLPASGRKCICGVSRSSSVVSNRSASSPEPDSIQRNPLSPTSPQSCRSESSVSESHASSPELTWVRQAIVRYWYN